MTHTLTHTAPLGRRKMANELAYANRGGGGEG
jgi:hypothetical protein